MWIHPLTILSKFPMNKSLSVWRLVEYTSWNQVNRKQNRCLLLLDCECEGDQHEEWTPFWSPVENRDSLWRPKVCRRFRINQTSAPCSCSDSNRSPILALPKATPTLRKRRRRSRICYSSLSFFISFPHKLYFNHPVKLCRKPVSTTKIRAWPCRRDKY